jgi:glycosyltransferase involved in cell wall biosynthesis
MMPSASMPLRVFHVCDTKLGAPWLCALLSRLRDRGYDVSVVIASNSPIQAKLVELRIPYHVLDHALLTPGAPLQALRRLCAFVSLLRRERPDVLHAHLFHSTVAARLAGWLADVPIRVSMNAGPYTLESPSLRAIETLTARTDTRVVASCEYTRGLFLAGGLPPDRVEMVYYGADAATFHPEPEARQRVRAELNFAPGTPLVGMVAHFYPPASPGTAAPPILWGRGLKGHDVLLRAIPAVLQRVPDARFVLVGDAFNDNSRAYRRTLEEMIDRLGIREAVIFTGHRTDVARLLASFDVALQCSLSENLGGTVEALLSAAPLIVSRTGGMVETVRHDHTGLVVPPDDPGALADAIVALLTDRPRALRLGAAGRALMLERFSADRTGADIDALYRSLAADPRFRDAPPRAAGYRAVRGLVRWPRLPLLAWQIWRRARSRRTESR